MMAFFETFIIFIINAPVDHASYKYCVVCMVKHIISINFGLLVIKAVAFNEISSLHTLYCVLCIVTFKIFHYLPMIVWLIGVKSNAIIEISSFSPASYIALCVTYMQIQKTILFHHWFGSLAVNTRAIIKILIISHQISAV